jgi:hypothetical protein
MNQHPEPHKGEAPAVASGQGFRDQEIAESLDFDANAVSEQDKAFATLRAKLALAGWTVHIIDGDNGAAAYWVSRWGRSRT